MKYDSHNRLVEYIISEQPIKKTKLLYDPIGRIFRKESHSGMTLESAIHYYYSGGNLIQEFDEMYEDSTVADDLTWDYLRGLGGQVVRRRKRNGVDDYTDMLHFNDMMGTAREEVNPTEVGSEVEGTPNGFVTTADGEPLKLQQPEEQEAYYISSNSQFHGGFLEDKNFHTNPINDGVMGYFYRMGIRHYSPGLGRFLQRDPFTYNHPSNSQFPLNANPYLYAYNRPTQYADRSGYQACQGPGCGKPLGNISPMPARPNAAGGGFGTDTGGGGGGGDGTHDPEKEGRICLRWFPEECTDPACFEWCWNRCCQWADEPPWAGCCSGALICGNPICPFGHELKTPPEWCRCACCMAGGGEHAPDMGACAGCG